MTAYDFDGNDWDEITEREKREIVDQLAGNLKREIAARDALSDDYETLVAEHEGHSRCAICNVDHCDPDTARLRESLRELVACLANATPVPGDLANALRNARTVLYGERP